MSWQTAENPPCPPPPDGVEMVLLPRAHDVGGFEVRRALPAHERQMVGPFIFFDQMGPGEFLAGGGLDVRPHPHIGLATVTYLFEGEILSWPCLFGQVGGLDKLGSGCRQAASLSIPLAPYASLGVQAPWAGRGDVPAARACSESLILVSESDRFVTQFRQSFGERSVHPLPPHRHQRSHDHGPKEQP